ncbi:perlucin-like [Ylistrum balloti]|uniref:perlucin-like n=1 Tax=Ylistrum balloti TaxID=509963 RepID=UPI002905980D|nr:perlucin-like [Ylistrum balloti]
MTVVSTCLLSTCGLYHAHLAEIESAREDTFLKQIISKYHDGHSNDAEYWLGGADIFVEGDWRWVYSDQRFNYTKWYPGEPNSYHSQKEDCLIVAIRQNREYRWDDRPCKEQNNFICEIGDSSGAIVIG